MEENKDTNKIEAEKSAIEAVMKKVDTLRGAFFIIYHLGLIGCIIGATANALHAFSHIDSNYPYKEFLIAFAIGIHLFASLLYKEYTREDK